MLNDKSALVILILILTCFIYGCENPSFIKNGEDDKINFITAIVNQSKETCDLLHAKSGHYSQERCIRYLTNESRLYIKEEYNDCKIDKECTTGGCSNEFCGPTLEIDDLATDCTWKNIYTCFRKTQCVCINEHCDWKKTQEYAECLGKVEENPTKKVESTEED